MVPPLSFHQEVQWIRLTKEDQVRRGTTFAIQTTRNVPASQLRSVSYYYTTDRNNPTQNAAQAYVSPPVPANLTRKVFLPIVALVNPSTLNVVSWWWDTSNVQLGKYYICAVANDGYNAATYCSEAPVNVVP